MNSRDKGKRGERQWRDELRANGFTARRGQQFCGGDDSPDVICPALDASVHFEVKLTNRLRMKDAMAQANSDAGRKVPILAHRENNCPWLVTMSADSFFKLLRGEIELTAEGQ